MDPARFNHPALGVVEGLLALRDYLTANRRDAAGQFAAYCARNLAHSQAQLFQDLMVLFVLRAKTGGYFVEFGATDGIDLSNTVLLERQFHWKGLLAEPARCWHAALRTNRQAAIDTRCVWSQSGQTLDFKEAEVKELSTLTSFVDRDLNSEGRRKGITYTVNTVSLNDLLREHNCPREIDYMSIDTEGSELPILQSFDFASYDIKVITVEHNYREPERQKIMELLMAKGFERLFEQMSKFDDWYVQRSIIGL